MQTEWFQSFVETIHTGSLSKAGEKLNISQTALSKQIKNLEDAFGVSLFHRTSAGMELTPEGQMLYEKVQVWLKDMDDVRRQLKNLKSTNHIIAGCLPSVASYYLPEKVLRLKSDGVEVDIRVFHTSHDIWNAFISGEVDIAILDRVVNVPKIYPAADLFTERFYTVVPNGHALSTRAEVRVADIAQEPLVLYPTKCDIRTAITQVVSDGAQLHVAAELSFGDAILGFVAAGAGITIVPELEARHLKTEGLTAVPIADADIGRTICWAAKSAAQFQFLNRYLQSK